MCCSTGEGAIVGHDVDDEDGSPGPSSESAVCAVTGVRASGCLDVTDVGTSRLVWLTPIIGAYSVCSADDVVLLSVDSSASLSSASTRYGITHMHLAHTRRSTQATQRARTLETAIAKPSLCRSLLCEISDGNVVLLTATLAGTQKGEAWRERAKSIHRAFLSSSHQYEHGNPLRVTLQGNPTHASRLTGSAKNIGSALTARNR